MVAATKGSDGEAILAAVARMIAMGELSRWGSSRLGRPIAGAVFGGGPDETRRPGLLVVGGVHGDESASVEAVLELVTRLAAEPAAASKLAAATKPAATTRWSAPIIVVPVLNPDGLAVDLKNASSDVDLNRNFPARNFSREHPPGYDPGPVPLSEPETALLARIIHERDIGAVVAVHAPFACVNFDGPALPWARLVAEASGWPVRENIGYPTPGSLGSWLGVDRSLPVLTLELPPGPLAAFRGAAAAALDAACAAAVGLHAP